jgi:hypothetical protein
MTLRLNQPDKTLVAACGLFCPSCAIYIASNEDPQRLKRQTDSLKLTIEETYCEGCRSEKRNANCKTCFMLKCTAEKGIDFCSECRNFPCRELQDFQSVMPHRIELWKDLARIKEVGDEAYFVEVLENYKCQNCGTLNSAWDLSCRKCGNTPSCKYVENNQAEINERIRKAISGKQVP